MSSSVPNRSGSSTASSASREQSVANSATPFQPLPAAEIEKLLKLRSTTHGTDEELGPGDVQYLRGSSTTQPVHPSPTRERATYSEPNSISNTAAEHGKELIEEQSSSRDSIARSATAASPTPTREQHSYSKPNSIAHPADPRPGHPADPRPGLSLEDLGDLELDISIELGRAELLIEDVLKLREGSVVSLDKLAGDPVDIVANGRLVARGELLVIEGKFGVRLSEVI